VARGYGPKKSPEHGVGEARLALAAIGLEAEFVVLLDGEPIAPEAVFGDPRTFLRGTLMHRRGTSYHLPTGGAIYFDTGVMEIATPVIEISRGCGARAGRSLWEGIHHVRTELDEWERRTGRDVKLAGFSAHYNVSFELTRSAQGRRRTVHKLALLLAHVLPFPVMLLATNRRSTGVGVRPRGDRVEVTVDFTPSPSLMIATATVITGIVRAVMRWESFELEMLERKRVRVPRDFRPVRHTSRKGWLADIDCYARNPFACDIDRDTFVTGDGGARTLRQIARSTLARFWPSIRSIGDPFTLRLIRSVARGSSPSLLELDDRPAAYEDVGRDSTWEDLYPAAVLSRSRYERVLIRAISGQKLHLKGRWYTPVGMRGWSQVVFREDGSQRRATFSIDALLRHLHRWEHPPVPPPSKGR
jgi:hypothetical protein